MTDHPISPQNANIPIIDLTSDNAASELLDAAASYGFVFVKQNETDVSSEQVSSVFKLARNFFSAPNEIKAGCTINIAANGHNRGWLPMQGETLDPSKQKKGDMKEAFNIGEFVNGKAQQPMPEPLQPHETELGDFFDGCHALCNRIMKLFALALKIPSERGGKHWFATRHDSARGISARVLRLLHYPALPTSMMTNPEEDIRAGAHSDYGSVTLLFRLPDQPGLEILTPEGKWATVPVNPEPGSGDETLPILVNIGDLLSHWTNGLLKSTVHRVIFPKKGDGGEDRMSIAYFCHPLDDEELSEIPSEVVAAQRRKMNGSAPDEKVLTAKGHLDSRLAATYNV